MSLRQTFARGFVWKLAGLLALAVVGWFAGIGNANAQTPDYSQCYSNILGNQPGPVCPSREVAYAEAYRACKASTIDTGSIKECAFSLLSGQAVRYRDVVYNGHSTWRSWTTECPTGSTWNDTTKKCEIPCSPNDPPLSGGYMKYEGSEPGYQTCSGGCEYNPSSMTYKTGTVDGVSYVSLDGWIPSGATCTAGPNDGYVPPSDADGDGVSDGNDTAPNNPGQGGGGGTEPSGEDGGQPGEGSGNGNQSTGGGDCATPPNSHGDQIGAQVAYQTWATRCAVENLKDKDGNVKTKESGGSGTGTGGTGTDMGVTNGKLDGIAGTLQAIKNWLDGLTTEAGGLDQDEGETEEPSSVWIEEPTEADLDAGGFGWGGSCPAPPTYMGESLDAGGNLCMFATIIGAFMLLGAYAQAAYIIGRA